MDYTLRIADEQPVDEIPEKHPKTDFHLTDVGNGKRLVSLHGDDIRYCWEWRKWLCWNGKCWVIDAPALVREKAKETIVGIYSKVAGMGATARRELVEHAKLSESATRIRAMMEMAASDELIRIHPSELDQHPMLLNVQNGTIDLNSLKLRPHRREDLLTQISPVSFDEAANCPHWLRFVDSIFNGNQDLARFLQCLMGYCLSGDVSAQVVPILYGGGSNGKSVLLKVVQELLGPDYAAVLTSGMMSVRKLDAHKTEQSDLAGKRFCCAIETEHGMKIAESLLKHLSGGENLRVRKCHKDSFEFAPTAKVCIATNHAPEISGTDHGIWRRMALVPFNQTFWDASKGESGPAELKADTRLLEKLRSEFPGILNWALKGCLRWQLEGLKQPGEVLEATKSYRQDQDIIGRFVTDSCILAPNAFSPSADLLKALREWAELNTIPPVSSNLLTNWLSRHKTQHNLSQGKRQHKRGWYGIGLISKD